MGFEKEIMKEFYLIQDYVSLKMALWKNYLLLFLSSFFLNIYFFKKRIHTESNKKIKKKNLITSCFFFLKNSPPYIKVEMFYWKVKKDRISNEDGKKSKGQERKNAAIYRPRNVTQIILKNGLC